MHNKLHHLHDSHRKHWNDFFGNGYTRFEDFDTNNVGYYDYLAKVNHYLHYLSHLFEEIQDILNDLEKHKHVPSVITLAPAIDSSGDWAHRQYEGKYLEVGNYDRTNVPDPDGTGILADEYGQQHHINTEKLDNAIDDIYNKLKDVHVPAILTETGDRLNLLGISNINRTDIPGDTKQQRHNIDLTRLNDIIESLTKAGISYTSKGDATWQGTWDLNDKAGQGGLKGLSYDKYLATGNKTPDDLKGVAIFVNPEPVIWVNCGVANAGKRVLGVNVVGGVDPTGIFYSKSIDAQSWDQTVPADGWVRILIDITLTAPFGSAIWLTNDDTNFQTHAATPIIATVNVEL